MQLSNERLAFLARIWMIGQNAGKSCTCFVAFNEHIPCFSQKTYSFGVLFIAFFLVVFFCWDFYFIFQFKLSKCVKCRIFQSIELPHHIITIRWYNFPCRKKNSADSNEEEQESERKSVQTPHTTHYYTPLSSHCLWILRCTALRYIRLCGL